MRRQYPRETSARCENSRCASTSTKVAGMIEPCRGPFTLTPHVTSLGTVAKLQYRCYMAAIAEE